MRSFTSIALFLCCIGLQAQMLRPGGLMKHRPSPPLRGSGMFLSTGQTVIDMGHMPSPYSYQHLGIFCKAEVRLNRLLPVPVMIRLGDVQRAEELDGKGRFPSVR